MGTETRNVWCERDDGQTVSDAMCSGTRPMASRSCSSSVCNAAMAPSTVESCAVVGTACIYDLSRFEVRSACKPHGTTDDKNIVDPDGFAVAGTGSACGTVGRTNSDGFWAPAMNTPSCPSGQSNELHLVHTCQGVCPSGKWSFSNKTYDLGIYGMETYSGVPTCLP